MKSNILYYITESISFKLENVRCPTCGGKNIEDVSYELAGNKYFDAENEKFYRCLGKRLAKYKQYLGEWDGKRQYERKTESIDCETEFIIIKSKNKKEVKGYDQISFL